jgi:hypothetical protein
MKYVRPNTASDSVTMPGRSSRFASGSLDSSTLPSTSASATTASGTWTRNTHCQLDNATMAPPMIGPKPSPMPKTTPQMAKALLRSLPCWNWCDSTATWQISMAPPAQALQEAADDQRRCVLRDAADQRGDAEQHDADDEHALAAIAVGHGAGRHQYRGAGEV